jgi:M6 family metalloprotease-like protein
VRLGIRRFGLVGIALVLIAPVVHGAPAAPGKRGRVEPPAHSVSRDVWARAAARLQAAGRAKPAPDSLSFVAVRIDFPDLAFGASPPADERHDRFYYENFFVYVRQYFDAASRGRTRLHFDVPDIVVHAARPQAEYGDVALYDSSMVELASEAIRGADPSVDFSAYDGVLLIHAGPGQESDINGDSPTQIWSGFIDNTTFREQLSTPDSTRTGVPTQDGVEIRNVVILPEWEVQDLPAVNPTRLGSLGVYAHEIGQRLGMVPLFDSTPSPVPDSQGLGNFDLMAYGLWVANGLIPTLPSAFNRMLMGWVDPLEVTTDGEFTLRDLERGSPDSTVARVRISAREYFLVSYVLEDPDGVRTDRPCVHGQCLDTPVTRRFFNFDNQDQSCCFGFEDRDGDGALSPGDIIDTYAGAEWDFFMTQPVGAGEPGEGFGLLILHVDEQVLQETLAAGSTDVEANPRRKAVDVEEADSIEDLDRVADNPNSFGSKADYWVRGHEFGPQSIPDSRSVDSAPTGIRITLESLPASTLRTPGPLATVRVSVGATSSSATAPRRTAWASDPRFEPQSLVAWPQIGGMRFVVPGADGQIFLLDHSLDDGVAGIGYTPAFVIPAGLRGTWAGPPAVGDLDGDGAPELVVAVNADSMGEPVGRVFAWRRDGREVRDLDGNPATNTGLLQSFAGTISSVLVSDFQRIGHSAVTVLVSSPSGVARSTQIGFQTLGGWRAYDGVTVTGQARGAPIATRLDGVNPDVAWAVTDSSAGTQSVVIEQHGPTPAAPRTVSVTWTQEPLRLASGDLDGDGRDDLVIVSADGKFWNRGRLVELGDRGFSPLALADLDGDGTLEVLAVGRRAMHVLSATGAERHGWPYPFDREPALQNEPAPGDAAGGPLVADLDDAGGLEILAHLRGGAMLVWNASGERRPDLEAALPARAAGTPLIADSLLVTAGRFSPTRAYLAGPGRLATAPAGELAVFRLLPQANLPHLRTVWGELGGSPGHTFRDDAPRSVMQSANDPSLASFAAGPNPARDRLRLRIELSADAAVHCRMFDLEGQIVRAAERQGSAGTVEEFEIDVHDLASGVYIAQLELSTGGRRSTPVVVQH